METEDMNEGSVNEQSVDEGPVDEISVDEESMDDISVGEESLEMSVGEEPVDEESVDEESVDEESIMRKLILLAARGEAKYFVARVGPPGKTVDIQIPEILVHKRAPFIENALSGPRTEATSRIINFPDVSVRIFSVYHHWLYTYRNCLRQVRGQGKPWIALDADQLLECYVFGDFLQDGEFKDCVIDMIDYLVFDRGYMCDLHGNPDVESMLEMADVIYDHSRSFEMDDYDHRGNIVDGSPRRLAVEWLLVNGDLGKDCIIKNKRVARDMLMTMGYRYRHDKSDETFGGGLPRCAFHDHGEDKPCYKTKWTRREYEGVSIL